MPSKKKKSVKENTKTVMEELTKNDVKLTPQEEKNLEQTLINNKQHSIENLENILKENLDDDDDIKKALDPNNRPPPLNNEVGYDLAFERLKKESNKVDLSKLGLLACELNKFLIHPLMTNYLNSILRYGIAHKKMISKYMMEQALLVRDLAPAIDLLDGTPRNERDNKGPKPIPHNQWIQPTTVFPYSFNRYGDETENERCITVYQTGRESKNDLKTILVYGIEFLNGFNDTIVERVEFWRGNVKLITFLDIEKRRPNIFNMDTNVPVLPDSSWDEKQKPSYITGVPNTIYHNDMILLSTAILYKENDILNIKFRFKNNIRNNDHDEIKILGFVIEPLGLTAIG